MVKTYSNRKHGNKRVTKNFVVSEFACNDGSDKVLVDTRTAQFLQVARNLTQAPIIITSAYRTQSYNRLVGGVNGSYHTKGMACDTYSNRVTPLVLARIYELAGAAGIGYYTLQKFVHVDCRPYHSRWEQGSNVKTKSTFLTRDMIKEIQTLLNDISKKVHRKRYYAGAVDGVLGPKTMNAFIYFCKHAKTKKPVMLKILSK